MDSCFVYRIVVQTLRLLQQHRQLCEITECLDILPNNVPMHQQMHRRLPNKNEIKLNWIEKTTIKYIDSRRRFKMFLLLCPELLQHVVHGPKLVLDHLHRRRQLLLRPMLWLQSCSPNKGNWWLHVLLPYSEKKKRKEEKLQIPNKKKRSHNEPTQYLEHLFCSLRPLPLDS